PRKERRRKRSLSTSAGFFRERQAAVKLPKARLQPWTRLVLDNAPVSDRRTVLIRCSWGGVTLRLSWCYRKALRLLSLLPDWQGGRFREPVHCFNVAALPPYSSRQTSRRRSTSWARMSRSAVPNGGSAEIAARMGSRA